MLKATGLRAIQVGHWLSLRPARARFERAVRNCEAAQAERLRVLLAANAASAYGRAHRFDAIASVREWQARVPIVGYDELQSWVERAAAGEPAVLTTAPIRVFERTSGSTAANKLVPYTAALLDEFGAATGPWLHGLYAAFPRLRGTTSYWSVSPATRQPERTAGGVPLGFADDTEYFGIVERFALRHMLAVPSRVARIGGMDEWADETAAHLVAAADLGLISVWHPSFFSLLLRRIEARLDACLERGSASRAAAVRARLGHVTLGEALWPRLAVVSCWTEGAAASAAAALHAQLPHVQIQPKGLLATEGVVSLPIQVGEGWANVAAVAGHFLEFVDLDRPSAPPRLAHELAIGAAYAPVISTGGGFYRYRLGDAMRCAGFHRQAPLLSFEGRIDQVSDVCGEKLNPSLVAAALGEAQRATGVTLAFALMAPAAGDPPRYCLYAEGADGTTLGRLCEVVERRLCDSHGYRYARELGQLAPIRGVAVSDGAARYLQARTAAGMRAGDIKPAQLDNSLDWSAVFRSAVPAAPVCAEAAT